MDDDFQAVWKERAVIRAALQRSGVAAHDIEDVAQEVCLGAWRVLQSGRFAPVAGLRAGAALRCWLRGIARRQARDHRRRSARRGVELLPDDLVEPAPSADVRLERRAEVEALGELAAAQQLVLVAAAEGCSVEEIAAMTGAPAQTAWARLREARSAAAAALKRHRARERFAETRGHRLTR
ncbi:sigma factor-like helix-turn-helix DNA-binding protein [Sorangium sp. So ce375]|uniref:RNA polymerase sigma factor n=1 Tax=Sorangium sp. So ce375 TaxID=3133306 RepID=UPI003F5C4192